MAQRAFIAVVVGSVIAGLTGLFIKNITVPATSMAFVRMGIPVVVLGTWMWSAGIRFFRGNYKKMLVASALNAVRMYLFLLAYIYTTITQAVIILFTWPVFVNILSTFWLKEKISIKQIVVLLLCFLGIVVIFINQTFSFQNRDFVGMAAGIFSALFYSVSYIIYKTEIDNYKRNEIIFYQNLIGTLFFMPFFILATQIPTMKDMLLMTGYGLIMGILIFNFFFYGLKYLKASQASLIHYLEIISAVGTGVLFFGDKITINILIGGILILGSIGYLKSSRTRPK